ncbi:MAG: zinc-ribbon domain-containing protein [Lachnospiraceae bacterium]|nr:zinc-ribbon domain-containing protein [Lachnospiraceae bacterium]
MFCTKCGAQIKEGAGFCTSCGAQVRKAVKITPDPQPAPPKRNLGKILGLAIGIPVGVLTIIAGIIIAIVVYRKNNYYFPNTPTNGVVNGRDDNGESPANSGTSGNGGNTADPGSTGTSENGGSNLPPAVSGDLAKRTLMIYMVGSNLETETDEYYGGAATDDIYEMCAAELPDDCNIILECGGAHTWVHPDVPDGEVTRFKIENNDIVELEKLGRVTMTREGDLADFISYAAGNYPAENYTLILWNHGGGIPVGFGSDELGDEYDTMCDYEIRGELQKAGVKFDAVIFDACNMCTLEMARALEEHADYMVGAESYVNGTGIYYTNWVEMLGGDARSFSEKIVQDYMDMNEKDGLIGSMSVIRLDYIDDVYDAYINYISEAGSALSAGDYATYYQARGNCGYYEENDSVDLITLATSYNNSNSTPLINAVVNAVVYTESDFVYGHGLMAYSPYDAYYMYYLGRESFVELDYDESIIDFYDGFISRRLAFLGDEYVGAYGGSWYVEDFETEVASAGGVASEYELPVYEGDYYYYLDISDELWDTFYYISQTLWVERDDGSILLLGEEYDYKVDSNGRLALVDPHAWVHVNDNIATYYCIDYYEDTELGVWAQTGVIPITVNGTGALLYIYYDNDNPSGVVEGYSYYDYDTGEESDTIYGVNMEDEFDLVYQYLDAEGNEYYEPAGDPFNAEEIRLQYLTIDLDEYTTLGYYDIVDVYGNLYSCEPQYFGSINNLE